MTTTYYFATPTYNSVNPDFPAFTNLMNINGSFTLTEALWSNLFDADISNKITSWSFSDGVNQYTESNSTLSAVTVSTVVRGEAAIIYKYGFTVKQNDSTYALICNSTTLNPAFVSKGTTTVAAITAIFSNTPP